MEPILDADAAAGKCTKTTGTTGTTVRKPMTSYLYPDGTLIRIKPQGDAFTSTPKYSVEVTKQAGVSGTQDDIAFKVESDGRATPKGPEDVNNPYSEPDNPNQYRATTTRR